MLPSRTGWSPPLPCAAPAHPTLSPAICVPPRPWAGAHGSFGAEGGGGVLPVTAAMLVVWHRALATTRTISEGAS